MSNKDIDGGDWDAELQRLGTRPVSRLNRRQSLSPRHRQRWPGCSAANDFSLPQISERSDGTSVIAGYPWFADWGRDTMISLPGLCS